ncbi:hypothetical protein [Desulfoferrobacter suflitae]|uniref:hypothetical protein n=1 Tax=Desulfoferrobacter suflitae TaxID=2865782 RepID=UPI002164CA88|nr:hypothetical protein [Desulfoferrobacter suflitae]MCK8600121.1 hypothetical protein [Desulfoferrobacter suflitae]
MEKALIPCYLRILKTAVGFTIWLYPGYPKCRLRLADYCLVVRQTGEVEYFQDSICRSLEAASVDARTEIAPHPELPRLIELLRQEILPRMPAEDNIGFLKIAPQGAGEVSVLFSSQSVRDAGKFLSNLSDTIEMLVNSLAPDISYLSYRAIYAGLPDEAKKAVRKALEEDPVSFEALLDAWFLNLAGWFHGSLLAEVYESLDEAVPPLYRDATLHDKGALFEVHPDLLPYLMATDCDLLWDHLLLPYPACYFHFGATGMDLLPDSKEAGTSWVRERYDVVGAYLVDMGEQLLITVLGQHAKTHDDFHRNIILPKEPGRRIWETVEDSLPGTHEYITRDIASLILSTLLFITSDSYRGELRDELKPLIEKMKRTQNPKKLRSAERRAATARRYTIIRSAKSLPKMERKAGETAYTIARMVSVRGHHKMQPHGPKRSLRKLIWIAPYIRGREYEKGVEGGPRDYLVKR